MVRGDADPGLRSGAGGRGRVCPGRRIEGAGPDAPLHGGSHEGLLPGSRDRAWDTGVGRRLVLGRGQRGRGRGDPASDARDVRAGRLNGLLWIGSDAVSGYIVTVI